MPDRFMILGLWIPAGRYRYGSNRGFGDGDTTVSISASRRGL